MIWRNEGNMVLILALYFSIIAGQPLNHCYAWNPLRDFQCKQVKNSAMFSFRHSLTLVYMYVRGISMSKSVHSVIAAARNVNDDNKNSWGMNLSICAVPEHSLTYEPYQYWNLIRLVILQTNYSHKTDHQEWQLIKVYEANPTINYPGATLF